MPGEEGGQSHGEGVRSRDGTEGAQESVERVNENSAGVM